MSVDMWTLLLAVGAAARLTRLVTEDTITEPLRTWVWPPHRWDDSRPGYPQQVTSYHRRHPIRGWVDDLLTCPWCAGFWISAAVVGTWLAWGDTIGWQAAALTLTVNYVQALANTRLEP